MDCVVTKHPDPEKKKKVVPFLLDLGMIELAKSTDWEGSYSVMMDGKLLGTIEDKMATRVVDKLRFYKITEQVGSLIRSFRTSALTRA